MVVNENSGCQGDDHTSLGTQGYSSIPNFRSWPRRTQNSLGPNNKLHNHKKTLHFSSLPLLLSSARKFEYFLENAPSRHRLYMTSRTLLEEAWNKLEQFDTSP